MAVITKGPAIGDIILAEEPLKYCRCDHEVVGMTPAQIATAIAAGTLVAADGLLPGQAMDFSAAPVAAVQTFAAPVGAPLADAGTYRLGFQGIWTAPIAWNANAAAVKAAFELISGTYRGVAITITASAAACITGTTITFVNTMGNVPVIQFDGRLCLDTPVAMTGGVFLTTTFGELTSFKEFATTSANIDSILLEPVSIAQLGGDGNSLKRSFLTRGPATVNWDAINCPAGTAAAGIAALVALTPSILARREPVNQNSGTPRA